jgi:Leucine-rich repeat (LRR) protein
MRKIIQWFTSPKRILWVVFLAAAAAFLFSIEIATADVVYNCSTQSDIPTGECEILLDLFDTTGGTGWTTQTNWLDPYPCTWYGITCSGGHVISIELPSNVLTGAFPTAVTGLPNLSTLDLSFNSLTGNIPAELGDTSNLWTLNLSENSLSGFIPSTLGNLTNLNFLSLDGNASLTGPIPLSFTSLTNLDYFYFTSTDLCEPSDTTWTSWFSAITNHEGTGVGCYELCSIQTDVPVADCEALVDFFAGTVGQDWIDNSGWFSLDICTTWHGIGCYSGRVSSIIMSANNVGGELLPSFGDLDGLRIISLPSNNIGGSLPTQIGLLTNVYQMIFTGNQFSGSIPSEIGDMVALEYIYLESNQLTGSIPSSIGNLAALHSLYLPYNDLDGSIPSAIGDLDNLQVLHLSGNELTGTIPSELGNMDSLENLYLQSNNLEGSLPSSLGSISTLINFNVSNNLLDGELPVELGSLPSLTQLFLDTNSFTGAIPQNFTDLTLSNFTYQSTSLCEPQNPTFQAWLTGLPSVTGTGIPCPTTLIFEDGFETGDFSAWSRVNLGSGFLTVCHEAAMNGSWGACVDRGTNDNRKVLIDDTPVDQTSFSARFNMDINSFSMPDGTRFRFLEAKRGLPRTFFLVLRRLSGQYQIQFNILVDGGIKYKSAWYALSDTPHTLEIDWQASSADGANDGYIQLYMDDALLEEMTGLDNDTHIVSSLRIGFIGRLEGSPISGIWHVDDVATSSAGYIGLP